MSPGLWRLRKSTSWLVRRFFCRILPTTTPARRVGAELAATPGAAAGPRPGDRTVLVQAVDRFVEVAHEAAAAELAVGEDLEAQLLLPREDAKNLPVLDLRQALGRDTGIAAGVAHLARSQEAADVIGAVHGIGYLNARRALRSCSALMPGPNSFSKKPSFTSRLTTLLSMTL